MKIFLAMSLVFGLMGAGNVFAAERTLVSCSEAANGKVLMGGTTYSLVFVTSEAGNELAPSYRLVISKPVSDDIPQKISLKNGNSNWLLGKDGVYSVTANFGQSGYVVIHANISSQNGLVDINLLMPNDERIDTKGAVTNLKCLAPR